jgi:hypothetical protein
MSKKFVAILDDEDADLLKSFQRIFVSMKIEAGEEPAAPTAEEPRRGRRTRTEEPEAPAAEDPPTTRRRRAGADAGSSSTERASDAGDSAGPRRSRRSAEPEPAAEEPRRRRRVEEPKDDRITDADLTKAASQAGEKLTPKLVMRIIKEDYGVETVNEIPQDKRREFLDTLKYEMEG